MEYCKYHPLESATYHCINCQTYHCDDCCQFANRTAFADCYMCGSELSSLGSSNNITPFWRRLQESFTYPINFDTIFLIIGLAVLSAFTSYIPFGFLIQLLLTCAL
jgi:hypothetical protein